MIRAYNKSAADALTNIVLNDILVIRLKITKGPREEPTSIQLVKALKIYWLSASSVFTISLTSVVITTPSPVSDKNDKITAKVMRTRE